MNERVFILIPAYNEGQVLRHTIQPLLDNHYDVILVDDGSDTPQDECIQDLPVHVLRHAVNLGQGAALQTAMTYARSLSADIVIHFDADGQHDVNDIPKFLDAIHNGADIVLGSRFLRPEDMALVPPKKRLLLRLARIINGLFTGVWLSDAHNGFRALNRHALELLELKENKMAHATEILVLAKDLKLNIQEVPVTIRYSEYSLRKGQKWSNSINILIDLILNKIM